MTELESIKEAFIRLLRQERAKINRVLLSDPYYIGKATAWEEAIEIIKGFRE